MTIFPTRFGSACIVAGIAGSWPSALAALFVSRILLAGHGDSESIIIAAPLSVIIAGVVGWAVWPSARAAPGLWGLYSVLTIVPMCSLWAVLGEMSRPDAKVLEVVTSSWTVPFLAAPIAILLGLFVGWDVSLVLRLVERTRERTGIRLGWFAAVAVLALHYVAAIPLVIYSVNVPIPSATRDFLRTSSRGSGRVEIQILTHGD